MLERNKLVPELMVSDLQGSLAWLYPNPRRLIQHG